MEERNSCIYSGKGFRKKVKIRAEGENGLILLFLVGLVFNIIQPILYVLKLRVFVARPRHITLVATISMLSQVEAFQAVACLFSQIVN